MFVPPDVKDNVASCAEIRRIGGGYRHERDGALYYFKP
jgi:hypothetical protein